MQQSRYRIWLQPGVERIPRRLGGAKAISAEFFCADGVDVTVEGDGADLEKYLNARHDLFNSWDRVRDEGAKTGRRETNIRSDLLALCAAFFYLAA